MIALTGKLFSFRKEVSNRWIIIRNGTTKPGLFPDLISLLALHYLINVKTLGRNDFKRKFFSNRSKIFNLSYSKSGITNTSIIICFYL